ncbi:MAG: hypothetical protein JSW61_04040 [Candidatus Thorarchaeota archaeon]|nr:MAG: hypothetical protein JSW61_04040 [Candidatus Thorarchaeota archaeon]
MLQITTDVPAPDPLIFSIVMLNVLIFTLFVVYSAYWLYSKSEEEMDQDPSLKATLIRIGPAVLVILAVTAPISINIYFDPERLPLVYVMGLWWMSIGLSLTDTMIDPLMLIAGIPLAIPRLAFVYMVHRFLIGQTTRRRVIMTGLFSELVMPILALVGNLYVIMVASQEYMIFIPLPLLLVLGLLMIRFIPPMPREKSWIEYTSESQSTSEQ